MPRLQRRITDYDRAIRALDDTKNLKGRVDRTPLNKFLYQKGKEDSFEDRKKLIKALERFRNPNYMEEYHRRFLYIQTKLDGIIPFKWKKPQRVLWEDVILPRILNDEPVRVYILKARQIGFSTLIEGIGTSLACLFSDFRSAVVAHDKETASKIHGMCKLFYKKLPKNFKPARKKSNRYELELANPIEDGELGLESSFRVGTAKNLHLGAGSSLRFIHLSEFARYEEVNAEASTSLITLFQTMPKKGGTFNFIETTGYGEGLGKSYWEDEYNGFDKLFISWLAEDEYTFDEPLKESELETKGRYGNELKARQIIIEELKVWNKEKNDEWLGHESLCRLNWRRDYIDTQSHGDLEMFKQEYPTTPEEAFRTTGKCVFNTYVLYNYKKLAEREGFPETYQYVPIKGGHGEFRKNKEGHLKMFHKPNPNDFYTIGLDPSGGFEDGDNAVCQVLDHKFRQCAVLTDKIEPGLYAKPAVCLAYLYNRAKIIPEANTMGSSVIDRIVKDLHYTNVYIRQRVNTIDGSITNEWGFYTSGRTRDYLITKGRLLINSGILRIYDLETIEELLSFIHRRKNNKIKMEAAANKKDDRVMSLLLALYAMETEEEIKRKREEMEPPMYSVEWHARQADKSNSGLSFGSPLGF